MIRLLLLFPLWLLAISFPTGREPVAPYLSGDTFRASCDHACDEISRFIPELVRRNQTVFVKGDMVQKFFAYYHPRIQSPYILISHNSDEMLPGRFQSYLDDPKILAWFTQNPDGTLHPKLHPIPIGVENRHWKPFNVELIAEVKEKQLPKTDLLYCNFTLSTYPKERNYVYALFANKPYTLTKSRNNQGWENFHPYTHEIAASKFVLCPRGNGLDTHRLWETLYLGSYPVTKTSPLDPLLEGLPVVIVDDWNQVNEEFLNQKYEEIRQKSYDMSKLFFDYWLREIDLCRQKTTGGLR